MMLPEREATVLEHIHLNDLTQNAVYDKEFGFVVT